MQKRSIRSFAALVLLFGGVGRVHAGLIVNGSFEDPAVPIGGYTNFLAGSTAITGWTVVGVDSSVVNTSFTQSGITFNAQEGQQWIDLAGVTSNDMSSGVSQSVATTVGREYELSFYVGSTTDHSLFFPSTVDLSIDGGSRVHYSNTDPPPTTMLDWKRFTVDFTATHSMTNLTFLNGDLRNNYVTALDNVQLIGVASVPEPSSLVMSSILLGILITAGIFRTTRKAKGDATRSLS
jgi:hypothetical protein